MKSKLYVGNLSYGTSEESLKAFFTQNGHTVMDVYLPRDRETGSSRGFAFVELGSPE